MSGERVPLLGSAVPTFETFVVQWDMLSELVPQCAPFIRTGLDRAKTYYEHMGKTRAYIIAMHKLILFN